MLIFTKKKKKKLMKQKERKKTHKQKRSGQTKIRTYALNKRMLYKHLKKDSQTQTNSCPNNFHLIISFDKKTNHERLGHKETTSTTNELKLDLCVLFSFLILIFE